MTNTALTLIIGNKNYSTWSLRPWIAMTVKGIGFAEIVVPFGSQAFSETVARVSGTGRVPVLMDGDIKVWESLAILEYLNEIPDAQLWPKDVAVRAHARVVAHEMHAGFQALRGAMPMNIARRVMKRALPEPAVADVKRIDALWTDCRDRFGGGGDFLFGAFCAADAMYVPVASRLRTYDVDVGPVARAYIDAVLSLPAYRQWAEAGIRETWVVLEDEVDWPDVHRA